MLVCSHAAASYGHVDLVDYLVQKGADLQLRDADGDTPLLVAEDIAVLQKLISHGGDLFATNHHGQGIVEKAFDDENEQLISFLFQFPGFVDNPAMVEKMQSFVAAMNGEVNGEFMGGIEEGDEEEDEAEEDEGGMDGDQDQE
jgi:uncharacterized protein